MSFPTGRVRRALIGTLGTPTAWGPGDSCAVLLCFWISAGFKHRVGGPDKARVFLVIVIMLRKRLWL